MSNPRGFPYDGVEPSCEGFGSSSYDMAVLFDKYPQLSALKNREFFLSGELSGAYGIRWTDDLDIEAETIYQEGQTVRTEKPAANIMVGHAVAAARARKGISQKELSEAAGIDQSDISKNRKRRGEPVCRNTEQDR